MICSIRTIASTLIFSAATALFISTALGQDASSATAQSTTLAPSAQLGQLEFQMRSNAPASAVFGNATGQYWGLIAQSKDFPRAYSFFSALSDEAARPDATLLSSKASAAGAYASWIMQNHLQEQAGKGAIEKLIKDSIAEYAQALQMDPDNFSALYGYAIFEGYRPGGQAHQKELLAKLDTLRTSKPYLPWALVDQLEKTGRPE